MQGPLLDELAPISSWAHVRLYREPRIPFGVCCEPERLNSYVCVCRLMQKAQSSHCRQQCNKLAILQALIYSAPITAPPAGRRNTRRARVAPRHDWTGSTTNNAGDRLHAGRTACEHHQQDTNGRGRKNNHLNKQGVYEDGWCGGRNWQSWEKEGEAGVGGRRKVWAANFTGWSAAIGWNWPDRQRWVSKI